LVAVTYESFQNRFELSNKIGFVRQSDLITDLWRDNITWAPEIRNHRYRPQTQGLEDHGSTEFPQRGKYQHVCPLKLRQGIRARDPTREGHRFFDPEGQR
jgi:hypothetical protein